MLLRQEVRDGIEVLSVRGPVEQQDAGSLLSAVGRLLALEPRGVVLDLAQVTRLTPEAVTALGGLCDVPAGWPRPSLVVCLPPGAELRGLPVVPDLDAAVERVQERPERLHAEVEVEHSLRGPAQARAALAACAERLGLHDVCDDLSLVVSEMVTNAVRHAAPPVRLELDADEDAVLICVSDGSCQRPTPRDADAAAEGGRGLLLVDALCAEHGVRAQPPGKAVWARLRRRGTAS